MDADRTDGRDIRHWGDDFEVDDGVWVLDLGEADARETAADPPRTARAAAPIMARDAQVKLADRGDPQVTLDLVMRDVELVKDEALSWLKALTHAL